MTPLGTTGIGSLPGSDPETAQRMVLDADLSTPYLAELPARGPGSDLIGRAAVRLVDLPVELHIGRWRLTSRGGIDARRARDLWRWDLDALELAADGYTGPLKLQIAGPYTLSAGVEMSNGHVVLTDRTALRDVAESQREGLNDLLCEVRTRVPGADPIVQLDEPSLPAVLAGSIPTASGYGRIPAVSAQDATELLSRYVRDLGAPVVVHTCAPAPPYAILASAGVSAALIDATLVRTADYDPMAEAIDRGMQIVLGVLDPQRQPTSSTIDTAAKKVREIANILGIPEGQRADLVGVSPTCGLAGTTEDIALAVTRATRKVASQVRDSP